MRHLIFTIFLAVAVPVVGCALMAQSNDTHHALEDHDYNVDKVVVKVKNGEKTVVVFMLEEVDDEAKKDIKAIVREQIPDADKVRIRKP